MAKRLLLRDAENLSADQLQRILGMQFFGAPAVVGVGTGFAAGVIGKLTGVATTGHLAVTADGATRILTILPGWAAVIRDAGGSSFDPRAFFAESDANDTVTATANATGSTRNDTVCLRIDQSTAPTSDGSNLISFEILAGAAGGGLANAPADGALHLPLANVAVANGATALSNGNVTDLRSGVLDFLSELRLTPPGGAASKMPAGTLGYVPVVVDQGSITTVVDLTGLTKTVTVGAGRRLRITGFVAMQSTIANDYAQLLITDGSNVLQNQSFWPLPIGGDNSFGICQAIVVPGAGSFTYKLRGARGVGAGTLTLKASVTTSYLLIEDIGT